MGSCNRRRGSWADARGLLTIRKAAISDKCRKNWEADAPRAAGARQVRLWERRATFLVCRVQTSVVFPSLALYAMIGGVLYAEAAPRARWRCCSRRRGIASHSQICALCHSLSLSIHAAARRSRRRRSASQRLPLHVAASRSLAVAPPPPAACPQRARLEEQRLHAAEHALGRRARCASAAAPLAGPAPRGAKRELRRHVAGAERARRATTAERHAAALGRRLALDRRLQLAPQRRQLPAPAPSSGCSPPGRPRPTPRRALGAGS